MTDWQSIESAPRDGTWCIVHYNDKCSPIITFYDEECFSGWAHQDRMGGNTPTHWMPLPEPPK